MVHWLVMTNYLLTCKLLQDDSSNNVVQCRRSVTIPYFLSFDAIVPVLSCRQCLAPPPCLHRRSTAAAKSVWVREVGRCGKCVAGEIGVPRNFRFWLTRVSRFSREVISKFPRISISVLSHAMTRNIMCTSCMCILPTTPRLTMALPI